MPVTNNSAPSYIRTGLLAREASSLLERRAALKQLRRWPVHCGRFSWDELRRRGEEKVRRDRACGVPEHESLRAMLRCLAGLPPVSPRVPGLLRIETSTSLVPV